MAATDSIRINLSALEDALLQAVTIARCLAEATAETHPSPFVHLFVHWTHAIDNAAQSVIEDVNTKCMPLLQDMARINTKS